MPQRKTKQEVVQQYCEFCGAQMDNIAGLVGRRKYCSERCSGTAARRRTSARLGIPPPRSRISRLSNPLYFN
ncbi:MAG TPA: hypothetical protein VN739_10240 [Nitrososphaerales archaeon]|nr:hypothetical protein [Nitrososphaerales archaeon]